MKKAALMVMVVFCNAVPIHVFGQEGEKEMVVPSLQKKGVKLTKEQIGSIREACKEAAQVMEDLRPQKVPGMKWAVLAKVNEYVFLRVLTAEQRAKTRPK